MKYLNVNSYPILIVLIVMLSGCSMLSPVKEPMQARYTIDPDLAIKSNGPSSNKILQVDTITAASPYQTTKMVYMRQPYQLDYFTRSQWVANPNQLMQQPIIDALQASHYYNQVVSGQAAVKADQRLACHLIQLQQNYLTQPSQMQLVMEVQLIDGNTQSIIAGRQFEIKQAAPFDTPYGGVLAANQAVAELQQQLVDFVVESSRQ